MESVETSLCDPLMLHRFIGRHALCGIPPTTTPDSALGPIFTLGKEGEDCSAESVEQIK